MDAEQIREDLKSDSSLPPLYDKWLSQLLGAIVPDETKATCSNCAMIVSDSSSTTSPSQGFLPSTKCCTYTPKIPNFLVGRILNHELQEMELGRRTILTRLSERQTVTPLFLGRSIEYERRYMGSRERYFGRMAALRCPHYVEEGGLCSIWRHREAVCSTYFCKHDRGDVGVSFWLRLREFLIEAEKELSRWCAISLGIEPSIVLALSDPESLPGLLKQLEHESNEPQLGQLAYQEIWGDWVHREEEFFAEAARMVSKLDLPQVSLIGGQELAARGAELTKAFAALQSQEVPTSLVPLQIEIQRESTGSLVVKSYSPTDPVRISQRLFHAITQFDGKTNEEVLEAIERESGLKISQALLRKLVDFRLLGKNPG